MKVSILMLAYNHDKFIAQALDSALMQQVDFEYEIVIGEDCSTDNTRDILIRYQQEYPDKIHLLLPEKNLGMHDNFIQTFKACRGDYIALLEGDDYWTSSDKIQKQVDFLDAHADYTICFHNILYYDDSTKCFFSPENHRKNVFTLEDILYSNLMATPSIMFRQGFIHKFPDWMYDVDFVDWVLQILLAQHGKIRYIDETMSVYRIHPQGKWSQKSSLEALLETTKMLQYLSKYLDLDSKHQKKLTVKLSVQIRELAIAYMENGDIKNAKFYMNIWIFKCLLNGNILIDKNFFKVSTILVVRIYIPILYKVLKRLK